VTELEVFTVTMTEAVEVEAKSEDHRVDGTVGYFVVPSVRFQYTTVARERLAVGAGRDLSQRTHQIQGRWTTGAYLLSGQYSINQVTREVERDTDFSLYQVSLGRGSGTRFYANLAWNRTADRGSGRVDDTDALSLTADWRAASRLRITQLVSYGKQIDRVFDSRSISMVLVTTIRSHPTRTLGVDFDRNDRWVDSEGGLGFRTFNDTGLLVTWTPLPLVSVSSNVRYQKRDSDGWTVRNFVTWSPLRGGRVDFFLSGNTFRDTRADSHQRGGSASARWRVRPGILVDASLGVQRLETAGVVETPVSTTVHAGWTF